MRYIVNPDWVECYCALDLSFSHWVDIEKYYVDDFIARRRVYGTRVYEYIFDVEYKRTPFMTICARPLSRKSLGGIMKDEMCHVKVDNYWLYRDDWYEILIHALRSFRINPIKLSRLDIACDWQFGQCGIAAADVLTGLMKRKYYKIHQPNWRANGTDSSQLSWHSLAFGSKSSPVFTRFYDKTLELQTTGKDYIRECWKSTGLNLQRHVYRTEFQLTDLGTQVIDVDTGEQFDITLQECADRQHLAALFFHYAQHYFDIRKAGTAVKRTECKRLEIFPAVPSPFIAPQRPRREKTDRVDRIVCRQMIRAMFAVDDIEARRHMLIALGNYVIAKKTNVLCTGAFRLLLDALRSNCINPDALADELFEMTREHFQVYDKKGLWLYEMVNDCRDAGFISMLEQEPTSDLIDEMNLTGTLFDNKPRA